MKERWLPVQTRFTIVRGVTQQKVVCTTTKETSFVITARLGCSQSTNAEGAIKRLPILYDAVCVQNVINATEHLALQDSHLSGPSLTGAAPFFAVCDFPNRLVRADGPPQSACRTASCPKI